MKGIKA